MSHADNNTSKLAKKSPLEKRASRIEERKKRLEETKKMTAENVQKVRDMVETNRKNLEEYLDDQRIVDDFHIIEDQQREQRVNHDSSKPPAREPPDDPSLSYWTFSFASPLQQRYLPQTTQFVAAIGDYLPPQHVFKDAISSAAVMAKNMTPYLADIAKCAADVAQRNILFQIRYRNWNAENCCMNIRCPNFGIAAALACPKCGSVVRPRRQFLMMPDQYKLILVDLNRALREKETVTIDLMREVFQAISSESSNADNTINAWRILLKAKFDSLDNQQDPQRLRVGQ